AAMHVGGPTARGDFWTLLLGRNLIYALTAIGVMFVASRLDVRAILQTRGPFNPVFLLMLLSLTLVAMTLIPGLGRSVDGASRWLYLGPRSWGLSFQPSELLKWAILPTLAWWCARRRGVMGHWLHGLLPPLVLSAIACGLVVVEDLGTAILIGAVAGCLLIA